VGAHNIKNPFLITSRKGHQCIHLIEKVVEL
jgi:hypothetical protein